MDRRSLLKTIAHRKQVRLTVRLGALILESKTITVKDLEEKGLSDRLQQALALAGHRRVIVLAGMPWTESGPRISRIVQPVTCDGKGTTLVIEAARL